MCDNCRTFAPEYSADSETEAIPVPVCWFLNSATLEELLAEAERVRFILTEQADSHSRRLDTPRVPRDGYGHHVALLDTLVDSATVGHDADSLARFLIVLDVP